MKDVIYLVVNANQVVRMTKTLPSLKRGEWSYSKCYKDGKEI